MKIKINREIEVPDKMICHMGRRDCDGLRRQYTETGECDGVARCENFNMCVFWSDEAGFYVKSRECIEATLQYFYGGIKK